MKYSSLTSSEIWLKLINNAVIRPFLLQTSYLPNFDKLKKGNGASDAEKCHFMKSWILYIAGNGTDNEETKISPKSDSTVISHDRGKRMECVRSNGIMSVSPILITTLWLLLKQSETPRIIFVSTFSCHQTFSKLPTCEVMLLLTVSYNIT